jgi:UDP-GlcNAc:undecaprenyl-phosphate/decaprenyl-phosphate GlcNAc-1-phosphate transferase
VEALWLPLLSFVSGLILIPILRWFGLRMGGVAMPRADRWHRQPTVILGGVAMYMSTFWVALFFVPGLKEYWAVLAGASLMFFVGLVDDIRPLSPPTKIIAQILAGSILVFAGYRIEFFTVELLNILITFGWLIAITNAINLLDNMDGLAGGISLIVALFLVYFFARVPGQQTYFYLVLVLCGAIASFLIFNFPPAKIFMGDNGSLFLGFILAASAVVRRASASNVFAVLGIPLLLFLLPILDTLLVTVTRVLRGQSPVQGGRDHTSHRLIAFGLNERQALVVLYTIAIISGVTSTIIERVAYDFSLLFVPGLIVALSIFAAYLGRLNVVPQKTTDSEVKTITRVVVGLTYRQKIFEVLLDFFLISSAYYLALWVQKNFRFSADQLTGFIETLPIVLGTTFLSFFVFGVYRSVWEFVGLQNVLQFLRAVSGSIGLVIASLVFIFGWEFGDGVITAIFFGMFLLIGLIGTRSSFRVLDQIYTSRQPRGKSRVLLYGAGATGEFVARWMLSNPHEGYDPGGFLDDDDRMWSREIHGIRVFGGIETMSGLLARGDFDGIVLTTPGMLDKLKLAETIRVCQQSGVWVRSFRVEFELIE